jgi:RHS repeat-associated protein
VRTFLPDTRGGYFSSPGDYGTLAALENEVFTLQEADGLVSTFGADGMLDYVSDPNGNTITCGYTGSNLTTLTHSCGQQLTIAYNAGHCIASVTDPAGQQTVFSYDTSGQHLVSATYSGGSTISYTYTDLQTVSTNVGLSNTLASITFPNGSHRYFNYDNQGRLAGTSLDNDTESQTYSYDTVGSIMVTDAFTNTATMYLNQNGIPVRVQNPLINSTYVAVDPNFNITAITDPSGRSTTYDYDGFGNVTQLTDTLGNLTDFSSQEPFNTLSLLTDSRNNSTTFSNDANGNLLSINYADNTVESWSHDSTGNAVSWTNRRGQTVSVARNNQGQITQKSYSDGRVIVYSYDTRGLLTNALDSAQGTTAVSYDSRGFLTNIAYPTGNGFGFTYNNAGQRSERVGSDGYTLYYSYDAVGRLAGLSNNVNGMLVQYSYDIASRLSREMKGNGTYTTYTYDKCGHISTITNAATDGTVESFFNYMYDAKGNRTAMATDSGITSYAYDDLNQLTGVTYSLGGGATYTYDSVGNRIIVNETTASDRYFVNVVNEYTQVGAKTFTYDADGNLTGRTDPSGTTTYAYDVENRLVSATTPTNGVWRFTYDAFGNRTAVIENEITNSYLIDPGGMGDVAAEYQDNGILVARFDDALGLVSRIDASGNAAYYGYDACGHTRQVTDSAGNVVNSYDYDAFGILLATQETIANPFQYVGRFGVMTDANGLQFMRARYYASDMGRFIGNDPTHYQGGPNFYVYAANNPLTFIDPTGTISWNDTSRLFTGAGQLGYGGFQIIGGAGALAVAAPVPLISVPFTGGAGAYLYVPYWAYAGYYAAVQFPSGVRNTQAGAQDLRLFYEENRDNFAELGTDILSDLAAPWDYVQQFALYLVSSGDPNQLIGPAGFGMQNYLTDNGLFGYEIRFENDTNATAPAQIVQITDPLSTNFNWSTFLLTGIAFGDKILSMPPNAQHFQTNLPFSYEGVNFVVQIEAGINLANGQVFADFYSIDPDTGLPPPVNIGFLPPEDGTGRGMGQISYLVRPQPNLPTGTLITNVADIQFDVNPIIATDQVSPTDPSLGIALSNEAPVTIDDSLPVSSVDSLPAVETSTNFSVCWSGTNAGPAIVSYDIYVSTNNGPWVPWFLGTSNSCGTFNGQLGATYGFYSIAHDGAGNVQVTPTASQAITSVTANSPVIINAPMWNGDGQFQFTFNSTTSVNYTVEYSTDLIHWVSILEFEGSGGTRTVVDPNAGGSTERFYRVKVEYP